MECLGLLVHDLYKIEAFCRMWLEITNNHEIQNDFMFLFHRYVTESTCGANCMQQSSNKWSVLLILKWKSHVESELQWLYIMLAQRTPTPGIIYLKTNVFVCTKCDERFFFVVSFDCCWSMTRMGIIRTREKKTYAPLKMNKTINLSNDTYRYKTQRPPGYKYY